MCDTKNEDIKNDVQIPRGVFLLPPTLRNPMNRVSYRQRGWNVIEDVRPEVEGISKFKENLKGAIMEI